MPSSLDRNAGDQQRTMCLKRRRVEGQDTLLKLQSACSRKAMVVIANDSSKAKVSGEAESECQSRREKAGGEAEKHC